MGKLFDDDGKVIDREALRSVSFGTVALRDPGSPDGPPLKVKDEGVPAAPSRGYTP